MTLYTSDRKRHIIIWSAVSTFCLIFFLIYNIFSHGVHSPYMTFLFIWPLILGVIPNTISLVICHHSCKEIHIGAFALNAYYSGIAAITASSMLRGIFDIAGNASVYQQWLMYAGAVMIGVGIAAGLIRYASLN